MKNEKLIEKNQERVSIFIDGSNFYHSIKKILREREQINYQKLIDLLAGNRKLIDVYYYIAHLDKNANSKMYEKHENFLRNLAEIPSLKIKFSNLKKVKINKDKFVYFVKGDDIQLAVDILMGAFDNLYDLAIIVSGDEDFVPLIDIIKKRFKKKIGNAYFRSSSSYRLRNMCNFSLKLNKLLSQFIDKIN